jgi:lipopolysaccharide cholinephosphotransferase
MTISARITKKNLLRARDILFDVVNFLEDERIGYHLEGGTLLGLVRDKELLPWDHDIDLSISVDDAGNFRRRKWKLFLKGYMITNGIIKRNIGPLKKGQCRIFKVKRIWPNIFRSVLPIVKRYIIVADIFVKSSDEKFTYWQAMDKIMKVDKRYYSDHEIIEYRGRKLKVPLDYKNYLTDKFGDWKTPVKTWNCAKDEKTILCDAS